MENFCSKLRLANAARQMEWDPSNKIDVSWRINELAGEMGELCNILKKLHREAVGLPGSRATLEQLREEMADVVICTDLLGLTLNSLPLRPAMLPIDSRRTLVETGVALVQQLGKLADRYGADMYFAERIIGILFALADGQGVDLMLATARKFNSTSEKVGLKTRIELS